MPNTSVQKLNIKALVEKMLEVLPERNRTIVKRRYGIDSARQETLEAIGRDYNITRERVRQIERASIEKIKNTSQYEGAAPIFEQIQAYISSHGSIVPASRLLEELTGQPQRAYLSLLLSMGERLTAMRESDEYYAAWASTEESAEGAQTLVKSVIDELRARGNSVTYEELMEIAKQKAGIYGMGASPQVIANYLALSKHIAAGPFGTWGLADWAEVNPRGVRDRAYLVFKKEQRPLHFREVASLIDRSVLARKERKTNPQTVHNELIKDERFVLVGHGLYALAEMGYQKGTVRDIIRRVLQEAQKPLPRDEVIKHVLKQRMVQENTIVLNLQNKGHFARDEEGRYHLA